ncbi:hypothetical protein ARALYDRAFT_316383 [Arabidopsis lyrata subsp. lyrata]|uniref:Uncharacterized protein n=1 Tax=Arabidopsis lyrata subsp. lyrata TaxID=81972 RepID=D7KS19_ARALL|nr:hypothetical protein ARALYDRAFT_316383 [Arabidopsis lyrata subsp. lyrata]
MSKRIGLFDLEKHFAFYGAYHSDPINIIIHTVEKQVLISTHTLFVFATLLFLYSTPPILDHSQLGFLQSLTFDSVLRLDIGFTLTLLCYVFSCWIGSSFLAARLGHSLTLKLLCWSGQFLGHGLFEKRAPALFNNLLQAFLMGPFFVLLEVLQSVFGYEPYSGFKARVNSKIESEIKEWRESKEKKKKKVT